MPENSSRPKSVGKRLPNDRRDDLLEIVLEREALAAHELAVKYIDERRCFASASSACRILKDDILITAIDYAVIKTFDACHDSATSTTGRGRPLHQLKDHPPFVTLKHMLSGAVV